ncbi:MAG: hypothetical protein RSA79_05940 [Oscillospiraceae bacterium]
MKRHTIIKKQLLSIVLVFCCFCFLTGCSTNASKKDLFDIVVDNPQTSIKAGEKVTYTAKLVNLTDKKYTLEHGEPLIALYICNVNNKTEEAVGSTLVSSVLEPNGNIEKTINVQLLETGEYTLRAYCTFKTDGQEYRLNYDDILITVVD